MRAVVAVPSQHYSPSVASKNECSEKLDLLEKVFFAASVPLSTSLCECRNGLSWHGRGYMGSGSWKAPVWKGAVEIAWSSLQLKAGPWFGLSAVALGSLWQRGDPAEKEGVQGTDPSAQNGAGLHWLLCFWNRKDGVRAEIKPQQQETINLAYLFMKLQPQSCHVLSDRCGESTASVD